MKKTVMIIMCAILIYSCDKSVTTSFYLENKTDYNGTAAFYYSDDTLIYELNPQSLLLTGQGGGLGTEVELSITADSVIFRLGNTNTVRYRKKSINNGEKNIYKEEYWEKNEISKHQYKYVFHITEDDLVTDY